MDFSLKERLYELLRKPKEFLQDGEKVTLEKDGMRITLSNDGEELSIHEENINIPEEQRWIPVSEKLPEVNKPILLYLKNSNNNEIQLTGYLYFTESESFKRFNNGFCINDGNATPEFVKKEYVKA